MNNVQDRIKQYLEQQSLKSKTPQHNNYDYAFSKELVIAIQLNEEHTKIKKEISEKLKKVDSISKAKLQKLDKGTVEQVVSKYLDHNEDWISNFLIQPQSFKTSNLRFTYLTVYSHIECLSMGLTSFQQFIEYLAGNVFVVLDLMKNENSNGMPPLESILKRDPSGRLFTLFRNLFHANPQPQDIFVKSKGKKPDANYFSFQNHFNSLEEENEDEDEDISIYNCILSKLNHSDNVIEYVKIKIKETSNDSFSLNLHSGKLFDYMKPYWRSVDNLNLKTSIDFFKSHFKKLTGKDFIKPSMKMDNQQKQDSLNSNQFIESPDGPTTLYQIPTFKEICFSALKRIFLRDKLQVVKKILEFPPDLLDDFITSCINDDTPVGFEIISKLKEMNKELLELKDDKILLSSLKRDSWFWFTYKYGSPQNIFYPNYQQRFAINVYNNDDENEDWNKRFQFKPISFPDNKLIIFNSSLTSSNSKLRDDTHCSIVEKNQFTKNLNQRTNSILSIIDWKNTVVVGESISDCLQQDPFVRDINIDGTTDNQSLFKTIEVCFYGLYSTEMLKDKLSEFVQQLSVAYGEENYTISQAYPDTVTISFHHPYPHIDISLLQYRSIEDILIRVPIDANCFAYDGTSVWTLDRGVFSLNYRSNIITSNSNIIDQLIRQSRLKEFLSKGFGIVYAPLYPSINSNDLQLHLDKIRNSIQYLDMESPDPEPDYLPFGPTITKDMFEDEIKSLIPRYENFNNFYRKLKLNLNDLIFL
eukprot:gene916-1157_t